MSAAKAGKPSTLRNILRKDLHDLSQPLMRLQWRLELGKYGGEAELRETIEGALADSLELVEWAQRLRVTIEETERTAA